MSGLTPVVAIVLFRPLRDQPTLPSLKNKIHFMASYFVVPFATILIDSGAAQSHAKACNRPTDPLDISE